MKKDEKITIDVVTGVEGPSVYINDHRVAGSKPWGGGKIVYKFDTTWSELKRALGIERKTK
jgi:hypothetical protein